MAAVAATNLNFVPPVELLNSSNYETWEAYMRANLKRRDLLDPIDVGPYHTRVIAGTVPSKSYSSELNRDKKALEAIKTSCGKEMLPHIIHAEFASQAWECLKQVVAEKDKYNEMVRKAAASTAILRRIPEVDKVLTRRNYGKWKIYMENMLISKYLWSVVDGSAKSGSPGYKTKNHNALVTIRISCGEEMYNHIFEEDHAHNAWCKLREVLGGATNTASIETTDSVAIAIPSRSTPPPPATFSNYDNWKDSMETHLKAQNLWGFLEKTNKLDSEKDEKALDEIKLHCPPHMQRFISYVDCAKSAWDELEAEKEEFSEAHETQNGEHSMGAEDRVPDTDRVLTRNNYEAWREHMMRHLQRLQLWNIVNNATKDDSFYTIKNDCALKIIKEACGRDMLCYIFYKTSANKAWNKLKKVASPAAEQKEGYSRYSQLLHAVQKNRFQEKITDEDSRNSVYYYWRGAKKFFRDFPEALTAEITEDGSTALHVAVRLGRVNFVEELLKLMTPAQLETKTHEGDTALSIAAKGNNIEIVKLLVDKNRYLLQIENKDGHNALAMAATDGDETVLRYLYKETPEIMLWKTGVTEKRIATLLTSAARHDAFDVVLDLLEKLSEKQSGELVFSRDSYGMNLLSVLARKPRAFPSGYKHGFFKRCIYLGGKQPLDSKVKQDRVRRILKCICLELPNLSPGQLENSLVNDAIHQSAIHGITEIFVNLIDTNPYLEHYVEKETGRGLFQIAIIARQENIYRYLSQMGQRNQNIALVDKFGNNTLHCVGYWVPSPQLDKAHGPALQMQREIQWLEEVERVVPPRYKDMKNNMRMTPKAFFTRQHKDLAQQGEKWMKDTSQACMVVATLIATVMFAAAFTLPGGNDQNSGIPLLLKSTAFKVFIISDALSLFASCTSILMFFSILTSSYLEREFLKALPTKLIAGLSTLFLSIATMMITFGTTLVIVLRGEASWVYFLVYIIASIPVLLFGFFQVPLYIRIFSSTYRSRLFNKKTPVISPLNSISYGQ
ncbi:hypothetical protein MKW92_043258 [Papaver armeniacum]|nr:hypothetical protein MKW92_043258 [Papaver armeniacum]